MNGRSVLAENVLNIAQELLFREMLLVAQVCGCGQLLQSVGGVYEMCHG